MNRRWLFLIVPAALAAQPPRGFDAWWDSPVVRDLNLTGEQTRQIRQTVREYRDRMVDLRAAVEKAENQLEDTFNDDPVDQRKASESIERLAAARAELTRAFAQLSLKLRAVLTSQQWHELQKRRPPAPPPPPPAPGTPAPAPRRAPPPAKPPVPDPATI